jgi:hypothetical protein
VVAVSEDGLDGLLGQAVRVEDLGALLGVLVGVALVLEVVDQPDDAPRLLVLTQR